MTELRLLLILCGVAVLIGIYLATRYGFSLPRRKSRPPVERQEPIVEVPAAEPEAEESPDTAAQSPLPPVLEDKPPAPKVIAIRLLSGDKQGFPGEKLILALRDADLRHGEFGIFHRVAEENEDRYLFSVASLSEPGSFDLTRIKIDFYPGVSIFLVLPGPVDGLAAFDDMLDTARKLAQTLEGDLRDEHGSTLSVQRERFLREEIIQYEHQPTVD